MSSARPEVAITGIGVVSPFGAGRDRFWQAIVAGQSGVMSVSGPDMDHLASRVSAQVPEAAIIEAESASGEPGSTGDARSDPGARPRSRELPCLRRARP